MDRFTGDIAATRRQDGSVHLAVRPGPLRVTALVVEQADPQFVSQAEDLITFHSVEADGTRRSYRYRIVGTEPGPAGGWLQCDPVDE